MKTFAVDSIGVVRAGNDGFLLELHEAYREGLRELAGFSHIDVLFWCHHLDEPRYRKLVTCERPYKRGPKAVGVFATRSPARPNPIALSPAQVLHVDPASGRIAVAFIDADDGSPILDIKPYHPATDRIRAVTVPEWCRHWPSWYEDNATFDWAGEFENAQ